MRARFRTASAAVALLAGVGLGAGAAFAQDVTQKVEATTRHGADAAQAPKGDGLTVINAAGETMDMASDLGDSADASVETPADDPAQTIVLDHPDAGRVLSSDVIGAEVKNRDGDDIGQIDQLLIDGDRVVGAVVGVGGFLGIGAKKVALKWSALTPAEHGYLVDATKQQLEQAQAFDRDVALAEGRRPAD